MTNSLDDADAIKWQPKRMLYSSTNHEYEDESIRNGLLSVRLNRSVHFHAFIPSCEAHALTYGMQQKYELGVHINSSNFIIDYSMSDFAGNISLLSAYIILLADVAHRIIVFRP